MSFSVNLVITTTVALMITSGVATGSGILFVVGGGESAGLAEILALNQLIQGVYLSSPGTSMTFLWSWLGCGAEFVCEGEETNVILPTTNLGCDLDLTIPDPASIVERMSCNGTHLSITYGLKMNNLTIHATASTVTLSRLQEGILIATAR